MRFLPIVLLLVLPWHAWAEQTDITFIVAGKTANQRQDHSAQIEVLNYHFFAEIFLQPDAEVNASSLQAPLAAVGVPFEDSGYALEANYPNGDYLFRYTAASAGTVSQVVL